ncbi:MAG: AAA family ATPase [Caldilineaceae bacterium]
MATRLADRLAAARRRQFVGREAEKALFLEAISAAEPSFSLLFIYGPGGIGKTSLLREFIRIAQQGEATTIYLDGRNIEASPAGFLASMNNVFGANTEENSFSLLERQSQRVVLLIDTYEYLSSLDTWLRDLFLPQIPANALVVIAGRNPPASSWHADTGWQSLIKVVSLRNLTPEESRQLLALHTVETSAQDEIVAFTHGHPLAISLITELVEQGVAFRLDSGPTPDVVRLLLQRFVEDTPSYLHKQTLEACALARHMTEGLLTAMLDRPDVHQYFDWLRGLSFIESGRMGLFPHDLVREAIAADLRWRNPELYAQLHQRARNYYHRRIHETQGAMQTRVLTDLVFLHRDNAVVRPFYEWQDNDSLWVDGARASDVPALVEMVRKHEGDASAQLAEFWLARQLGSTLLFRNRQQQAVGMLMLLQLNKATPEEIARDPATLKVWSYLQRHAPLRPNEQATFFRFWMDENHYQGLSSVQSRVFLACVQHYLTTPALAYTFFPCAQPEFFTAIFAYADLHRIPEADFIVGGQSYGVFGHDWRLMSPAAWLDLMAEREVAATASSPSTQAAAPKPAPQPILVLSQPEFADAARDALRQVNRTDELQRNPLMRSRLVLDRTGTESTLAQRATTLQTLLKETAQLLQSSPKTNRAYRALHHTYFQPAATQELAAELLDLPFSTYRRHLKEGIDHVVDTLWNRELGNVE